MPTNERHLNERKLLDLAATGDKNAFEKLFTTGANKIATYLLQFISSKELVTDIVQEIFLNLWKNRTGLTDISNFDNYLFVAARNQAYKLMRQKKLEYRMKSRMTDMAADVVNQDNSVDLCKIRKVYAESVKRLSPRQREVYFLSREEGLTRKQIATRLLIGEESVKEHLKQALKSIRKYFQHELGELWVPAALFFLSEATIF